MKHNTFIEIIVGVIFAILIGVLTYANDAWMPNMSTMLMLLAIVGFFGAFTVFVFNEKVIDEREKLIRFIASRIAFLATGIVLLTGIIVETITTYMPDPWLGLALVVMVSAKIIGQAYGRNKY